MSPREPIERLSGQLLLDDFALELDGVGAVLGRTLPSFESPVRWSVSEFPPVRPEGPIPIHSQTAISDEA